MAATPEPDPVPTPDPANVSVTGPGLADLPLAEPTPEPTKQRPVVLATANHLEVFVAGDVRITHAGAAVGKKQADELTTVAAQHGVHLIDITPEQKD